MLSSLRNTFLLQRKIINGDSSTTHLLYSLLLQNPSPLFPKSFSSSTNQTISSSPFIVSYLINSCGFSEDKAISASKQLRFKTSSQPDSVITFLENNGFTKPYIFKLISIRPGILSSDPLKTLKPKLDFYNSIGLSGLDLAKILSRDPDLLKRSVEKHLIPSYTYLKNTLHTNKNVIAALKRSSWIFLRDLNKTVVPNIELLRNQNVPESNINQLFITKPRALIVNTNIFQKMVMDLKQAGFDPLKLTFVLAIHGLTSMSKSTRESKLNVYRKWGWSEDEIRMAFKKQPYCMMASEEKITAIMDFLVNKMGTNSSLLAKHPSILMLSLKKRIIPRYLVLQVLISKGLIDRDFKIRCVLSMSEDSFLKKYVFKYGDEAPILLKVYQDQQYI